MKARVAYLCGTYPRATDTFIQHEVAALRQAGIEVHTLSVRRPIQREIGFEEQAAERRSTVYLLPCAPWRVIAAHVSLLLRRPACYLRAAWTAVSIRSPGLRSLVYQMFYFAEAGLVAAYLKRHAIGHIHNHSPDASGYVTMLAAEMSGAGYSLTLHGFGILSEPSRWRLRDKLARARFAICVSGFARSQAMLWSDKEHWRKFHVIHCGVDTDGIRLREHAGPGRRLLFIGRFDPVKGLPLMIEGLSDLSRHHPDIHLDMVGDGPQRESVERLVGEHGLADRVTFHGYLTQDQISRMHEITDVFVMTSFAEGIPVVLMEAMAAGLPVVAPRIAGIPELIQDGENGFLFTPGDVPGLVALTSELLTDPDLRNAFGAEGRRTVEQAFCLDTEVSRFARVMLEAVGDEIRCDTAEAAIGPGEPAVGDLTG